MILILIVIFLLFIFPLTRCFILNFHYVVFYSIKDIIHYIRFKEWLKFNLYGIDMFCGMFGHGKTLSLVHRANELYQHYGDKLHFVSNISLNGIPYTPLVSFEQLVDLGEIPFEDECVGTVVIIDEIENVLNNRNYAKFPLAMLHTLTQQRKKKVYIMCTAQRFFMVDKLFRSITTKVIDCNKIWRFQNYCVYDAWEYECAINPKLIQPYHFGCWFVHDSDFDCYDTSEMVSKSSAENFISNSEALERQGIVVPVATEQILRPSKKLRNIRGKSK